MRREVFGGYSDKIIVLALLAVTLGCEIMLAGEVSHAETATANAAVTVAEACTMTAIVDSAHSAIVNPGQYVSEIGQTTLKVVCNDASGYAIYAVGNANNEYGNNKLLASLGGTLNPTYDIATGTATSGSTSNWAMKVNAVSGAYAPAIQNSFGSYHDVPATYTKVAQYASNTDTSTGSSITSTYAAFVKSDQPAGNYDGKVKYTMVHPSTETPLQPQTSASGKICYYANASDAIGTMGCQNVASEVTLLASNFSRTGYGFAGWSDKFDYASNAEAHFYGPQEDLSIPDTSIYTGEGKGLSLYAVWVKSQGSIQDTSKVTSVCSALTTAPTNGTANLSSVSALTDQRDNNTYAIAKLADGKCWMIENLRLDNTNSDNSTGALAQGYGTSATYGNFGGLADSESANFSDSTTANSLYYSGTQSGDATINIGTTNYPGRRMPRYNNLNTQSRASNPTSNTFTNDNTTGGMYSYGNYYTWHAAIADLTYNGTNNSSVANTSLCPSGWHLPKGGNKSNEANNDFWSLVVAGINGGTNPANYESSTQPYYTGSPEGSDMSKAIRAYPNNFLYSGYFRTSSAYSRGSNGYYWSSTAYSINNSYYLGLNSSLVYPGTTYNSKYNGLSIRCTISAGT